MHFFSSSVTLQSKDESVAFFAYLKNDLVDPPAGQTVIFSGVDTNVGNAYDPNHGVFVAPVDGTYHFTFVGSVPPTANRALGLHLFLKKTGGKNEMYIFFDSNTQFWLHRSSSSILHLSRGDKIWMEVGNGWLHKTLAGYRQNDDAYHSHFSGFLIEAD